MKTNSLNVLIALSFLVGLVGCEKQEEPTVTLQILTTDDLRSELDINPTKRTSEFAKNMWAEIVRRIEGHSNYKKHYTLITNQEEWLLLIKTKKGADELNTFSLSLEDVFDQPPYEGKSIGIRVVDFAEQTTDLTNR